MYFSHTTVSTVEFRFYVFFRHQQHILKIENIIKSKLGFLGQKFVKKTFPGIKKIQGEKKIFQGKLGLFSNRKKSNLRNVKKNKNTIKNLVNYF